MEKLMGKEDIHPESALFNDLERLVGVLGKGAAHASVRQDAAQASLHLTSYPQTHMKR